jgi:hypothetical protein
LVAFPLVLAARDAFTFFCSMLHAKFQHKGFALWEGSHTPRPASPSHRKANRWCAFDYWCRAMTCETSRDGFPIRETDTLCFHDYRFHGRSLTCTTRVC